MQSPLGGQGQGPKMSYGAGTDGQVGAPAPPPSPAKRSGIITQCAGRGVNFPSLLPPLLPVHSDEDLKLVALQPPAPPPPDTPRLARRPA